MNSIHKFIKEKAGAVNHDLEFEIHGKAGRRNRLGIPQKPDLIICSSRDLILQNAKAHYNLTGQKTTYRSRYFG